MVLIVCDSLPVVEGEKSADCSQRREVGHEMLVYVTDPRQTQSWFFHLIGPRRRLQDCMWV